MNLPEIETERLILRSFTEADLEPLCGALCGIVVGSQLFDCDKFKEYCFSFRQNGL